MALSRAVQEVGPGENNRGLNHVKMITGNSDVGGSQTQNPLAEDVELEVFTTCSIYCIKYALWRRLQVPIQNLSLTLPGSSDLDLLNHLEVRHIMNYKGDAELLSNAQRKPTLQAFMSKPMAAALDLNLGLIIVNGFN